MRGGGVIENQFFPKFKIVQIILGGGGHEICGLFPQFVTFFVRKAPLSNVFTIQLQFHNQDNSLIELRFEFGFFFQGLTRPYIL